MTKQDKHRVAIRHNPKSVRFDDACTVAESIGFNRRGIEGSHCIYARAGEPMLLNFQNRQGLISAYQARQLIKMMDKYEEPQ